MRTVCVCTYAPLLASIRPQALQKMATSTSTSDVEIDLANLVVQVEGLALEEKLGSGAYGVVFKVTVNGENCIAKKLHDILAQADTTEQRNYIVSKFKEECRIHSGLKHPNIVSFVGVHYGRDQNDISLIMEQLHSDLDNYISKHPDTDLAARIKILHDVSKGLCYLHSLTPPLIHRDLTARNILLTEDHTAKIGDLGVSRYVDPSLASIALTTIPGNLYYMPPECRGVNPKYTIKLDIFSFGVLIVHTITGSVPKIFDLSFFGSIVPSLFGTVELNRRSTAVQEKMGKNHFLYPLVVHCLYDGPDQRPSAEAVSSSLRELCLTMFIDACKTGNVGVVQKLLECGADPNQTDEYGGSAVYWACNNGHDEVVRVLLVAKATVNTQTKSGQTPLWAASCSGHQNCVELLIDAGANVDMQRETGATVLCVAAQNGHLRVVELLIAVKAQVDIQKKNGATALLIASQQGYCEVVKVLLEAKADINIQTNTGATALCVAAHNGHLRVVELLIAAKIQVDIQEKNGGTALYLASHQGHCGVVRMLLEAKADVNIQRNNGTTALFIASHNGHCGVVRALLEAKADVNVQTNDFRGYTARDLARINGHTDVCELLN